MKIGNLKIVSLVLLIILLSSCAVKKSVNNNFRYAVQKRTMEQYFKDVNTAKKIKVELEQNIAGLNPNDYRIFVFNDTVIIAGKVRSKQQINMVNTLIFRMQDLQIYSVLEIGDRVSNNVLGDTLLKTRIVSSLIVESDVEASAIEIYVFQSIVYVMGFVTEEQEEYLINLIKSISGVDKIVVAFDYISLDNNQN